MSVDSAAAAADSYGKLDGNHLKEVNEMLKKVNVNVNDLRNIDFAHNNLLAKLYRFADTAFGTIKNAVKVNEPIAPNHDFISNNISHTNGGGIKYANVWSIIGTCFDAIVDITIPIATIFFMIAIYKTVISKPAEEQAKQFLLNALRFILVLIISANLFNILATTIQISDRLTNKIYNCDAGTGGAEEFPAGIDAINAVKDELRADIAKMENATQDVSGGTYVQYGITSTKPLDYKENKRRLDFDREFLKTLEDPKSFMEAKATADSFLNKQVGQAIKALQDKSCPFVFSWDFLEYIFEYILYFLCGVATIFMAAMTGFSILMAIISRIFKPLIMMPFAPIVVGMGACEGEGAQMVWHYAKSFLGCCLTGMFIAIALKISDYVEFDKLVVFGNIDGGLLSAIGAILSVNITYFAISGLVKSSDTYMSKMFG